MSDKPKLAEVTTLYSSNARDVVQQAKNLYQMLKKDSSDVEAVVAVLKLKDGQIIPFGWGDTGLMDAIAILTVGSQKLGRMQDPGDGSEIELGSGTNVDVADDEEDDQDS